MGLERRYTPQQVAETLRVDIRVVYRAIKSGDLRAEKSSGRWQVSKADMKAFRRAYRAQRTPRSVVMTRRRFLGRAAATIAVMSAFWDPAKELALLLADSQRKDEEARNLFRRLFGVTDQERAYDYALGRPKYSWGPQRFHPDNWAAGVSLAGPLGILGPNPDEFRLVGMGLQRSGDLYILGGTGSTAESMIIWENEGPDDQRLTRRTDAVLPMRWWGVSSIEHPTVAGRDRLGIRMEHAGPRAVVPWPFYDAKLHSFFGAYGGREHIRVRDSKVALPENDYLLVSRLPNILDPNFERIVDNGHQLPRLAVFDGGMGIGTRSAELLTQRCGLDSLERLALNLGGAHEFQALFEVYDREFDNDRQCHRFRSIRLIDQHIFDPSVVTMETYLRAHRYGIVRLEEAIAIIGDAD